MCLFSREIYKAHPQETSNSPAITTIEMLEIANEAILNRMPFLFS